MITKSVFIETLLRDNPGFCPDPEDVNDGLSYVIANDFARYIIDSEVRRETDKTRSALQSLEDLAAKNDSGITDLIHECLETLFENPDTNTESFKAQFGPHLQVLLHKLFPNKL